jgi:glycerol-3-phosphate O-acyltransferase / dihydroxyacetone phosphate acyltransferase
VPQASCGCNIAFTHNFSLVPVARAADDAKPGKGRVWLSEDDPCVVLGEGTSFTTEFSPKMQIMLPKSVGSAVAEVIEIVSDTELKIKREFGGESGKGTTKIKEKLAELKAKGVNGLEYKTLPFVDQQEMYRHVYSCLRDGGAIGIFPEGMSFFTFPVQPLFIPF